MGELFSLPLALLAALEAAWVTWPGRISTEIFDHRARVAFKAICLRWSGESFSARARRPFAGVTGWGVGGET